MALPSRQRIPSLHVQGPYRGTCTKGQLPRGDEEKVRDFRHQRSGAGRGSEGQRTPPTTLWASLAVRFLPREAVLPAQTHSRWQSCFGTGHSRSSGQGLGQEERLQKGQEARWALGSGFSESKTKLAKTRVEISD